MSDFEPEEPTARSHDLSGAKNDLRAESKNIFLSGFLHRHEYQNRKACLNGFDTVAGC